MDIRNFVIIAHIDHGKSTLADRFLELTGTVEHRRMHAQFLDMHPLEREKGITIKMQPVRMARHGRILNLIDTPGHADFSYEVSRALAAVEGAILLVDATQGVQAQTLANLHLARQEGLTIIPAINKIDLPSAEPERVREEVRRLLGCSPDDVQTISAKEGAGVAELLAAVEERTPSPEEKAAIYRETETVGGEAPLRALIFDSKYDPYLGVVAHVRIVDGTLKKGDTMRFLATDTSAEVLEIGVFAPERTPTDALTAGEIGYVATGIKEPARVRVGDTITRYIDISKHQHVPPLPGYRDVAPVVFAALFPENQDAYENLRDALGKLQLEDAALSFAPEDAGALGRGFRTGFLGLLHMEITAERLRREYGLALSLSRPSVAFRVTPASGGDPVLVYSASRMPGSHEIRQIEEPWARVEMVTPAHFLGALTSLVTSVGGIITRAETLAGDRLHVEGEAPVREIIVNFYDKLKSVSQGFASFSYEIIGYRPGDLVRLDIVIAGDNQPVLGDVVPSTRAYDIGRRRLAALKDILPKELFSVSLQAVVGGRVIARETIPALKKDVTGYMYGGDRTRKMKLWKKQQRGKKRLARTGRVSIPPDVFFKLHGTES